MRLAPHPYTPGDEPDQCAAVADGLMCLLPPSAYEHSLTAVVDAAITSPRGWVDPELLPTSALDQLLRNGAQEDGTAAAEAAVELLIRHGSWLRAAERADWRRQFITFGRNDQEPHRVDCAHVQWRGSLVALDNGQISASQTAGQMLRIAGSFGAADTAGVWCCLARECAGLDYDNACLVAAAVLHTAGYPGQITSVGRFLADAVAAGAMHGNDADQYAGQLNSLAGIGWQPWRIYRGQPEGPTDRPQMAAAQHRLDAAAQLLGSPDAEASGLSQADVAAEMVAAAEDVVDASGGGGGAGGRSWPRGFARHRVTG